MPRSISHRGRKDRETQRPDLLAQVQAVAAALDHALQAARKGRPGDPEREVRITEGVAALVGLLLDRGEVLLRFTEAWPLLETRTGAYPIPQPTLTELGRRAYKEGLRALRLGPDLDPAEGGRLLELLAAVPARPRTQDGPGPDLLTHLWEADLRSVGLEASAEPSGPRPEAAGGPGPEEKKNATRIHGEIRTPLVRNTGLYLLEALVEDPERWGRVGPIFSALLSQLVAKGDLAGATTLLAALDRTPGLLEKHRRSLLKALDPYRTSTWLDGVVSILDSLGSPEIVATFLHRLGPGAAATLIQGLHRPDAAHTLFDCLVQLARLDLRPFRDALQEEEAKTELLRVLAELADPAVLPLVRPLLAHPEPQIRALALKAASAGPLLETRPLLHQALEDPALLVRVAALRVLGQKGDRSDLDPLMRMIMARAFHNREAQEKQALLEALARLGGTEVLELLGRLLEGARSQASEATEESQICAARALALVPGEEARQMLIQAFQAGSPALRRACLGALQGTKDSPPADSPSPRS